MKKYIDKIIDALAVSRDGMTAAELFAAIGHHDMVSVRSYISSLAARKYIRVDGRKKCPECYNGHVVYRITEHGKLWKASR